MPIVLQTTNLHNRPNRTEAKKSTIFLRSFGQCVFQRTGGLLGNGPDLEFDADKYSLSVVDQTLDALLQ